MLIHILKRYRAENNLSQQSMANMLGMKQQYSRVESGVNSPSFNSVLKILNKIGYEVKINKKEGVL